MVDVEMVDVGVPLGVPLDDTNYIIAHVGIPILTSSHPSPENSYDNDNKAPKEDFFLRQRKSK